MTNAPRIRFGTDGWRAVIADEFTLENVRVCAAAIADWVKQTPGADQRGIVVGHDCRFMSEQFAVATMEAILGQGVRVLWCEHGPVPTPVVTFTVPHTSAAAGVMITASHNPAEYNGIKVKTANGAPASRAVTDMIESYADSRFAVSEAPPRITLAETFLDGRHMPINPFPAYQDAVRALVDIEAIRRSGLRIVVDAMYGAAAGVLQKLLGTGPGMRPIIEIRSERNPQFPGMKGPEPVAETLAPLMVAVRAHGADIGIAFDGDGDRIALVDGNGEYVSSQETFAMLAMYLGERADITDGPIVRSVNGTVRLDLLAERYGVSLIETPIGYGHIAPAMVDYKAMLGGEESGGFAFGTHLPERDAPLAALYLLDMLARRGTDIAGLRYAVQIRVGEWSYRRVDVSLDPVMIDGLRARLSQTDTSAIDLAGTPVKYTITLDGLKLVGEDRRWLLVRASGTEPLARIYAEAREPATVDALIELGRTLLLAPLPSLPAAPATASLADVDRPSTRTSTRKPSRYTRH